MKKQHYTFEQQARELLGNAVKSYREDDDTDHGYMVTIKIVDDTPMRLSDLAKLSEILGTDEIDIKSGRLDDGYSEYTPGGYNEGSIEARWCGKRKSR